MFESKQVVIKEELKEATPVEVNEIQTKRQDPSNRLYKVKFKRSEISFNQGNKIGRINRMIVSWKPHRVNELLHVETVGVETIQRLTVLIKI